MSQSSDRDDMLGNIRSSIQGGFPLLQDNNLAVGSPSGYEFLLPKYSISTGRDGDTEALSQCRIYMDEANSWFSKTDFKLGNIEPEGRSYVGFLLTGVQESKSEKVQTTPLNGDNYAATFYGQSPTIYSFSGILYNTHFAPWREIFTILYDKAFRGSRISRHRKLLHIVYDNKVVSGWMLNLSQSLSAASDTMSNFSFQFLVRSETILTPTSQLSYNNAYFTGSPVKGQGLDTLEDLPEYDDYINSARIRTPPKRQRGSGGRRKAYGCRPGRGSTQKDGNKLKANPRFAGQNIRTGSPTSTSCDVVEAALETIRTRNKIKAKAREKYSKIRNPTKEQTEAFDREMTKADQDARRLLLVSWNDLRNRKKIKDTSAKERAEAFFKTISAAGVADKNSFIKYTLKFDAAKDAPSIESTFSGLPELNYSTPAEVKSDAT